MKDVSKCKHCDTTITGGNSSNVKSYLRSQHKKEYDEVQNANALKNNKKNSQKDSKNASTSRGIGLCGYFKPIKITQYAKQSSEYCARLKLLINLYTNARLPSHLIDQTEFQNFCTQIDPRFKLPRVSIYSEVFIICFYCNYIKIIYSINQVNVLPNYEGIYAFLNPNFIC